MKMLGTNTLTELGPGPFHGIIKSYNEAKGFGFVECEATKSGFGCDVFLHRKHMPNLQCVGCEV